MGLRRRRGRWKLELMKSLIWMLVSLGLVAMAAGADAPKSSPEGQARLEAAKAKKGLKVRGDCWRGEISGEKGRAVRLQLFKGLTYELYLAAGAGEKGKGTKMHIGVMNRESELVAKAVGKGHVAKLVFSPEATGTYMVLLRAELTSGDAKRAVPCALVMGYR